MKHVYSLLLGVACLLAATLPAFAEAPAVPAEPVDDYEQFQAIYHQPSPADLAPLDRLRWSDQQMKNGFAAGLAYLAKHPDDPRRWDVVLILRRARPLFIAGFKPGVETLAPREMLAAAIRDEAAKAQWTAKVEELTQALIASSDATPAQRERLDWQKFLTQSIPEANPGRPPETTAITATLLAHLRTYAAVEAGFDQRLDRFVGSLERISPGSSGKIWLTLSQEAPTEALRQHAAGRLRFVEMQTKGLDFTFTAVDGRPVDLVKLRGKVVLVDFWATWCGPCKAELPNVVATYKKYHDQGFEVVGIALENGRLAPTDTPEQTAAKLAKAKQVLVDFTAANDMPWPQYCDGKYWSTSFAVDFGVNGIPAMFLLDQEGRIVSRDARGPKLAAEVKRLLKL